MRGFTAVHMIAFILMALPAWAQVTCIQLGAFTDCSGPGNRSATQVDLGSGMGVTIGPNTTTPYTALPSSPRASSSRSSVPTFLYSAPSPSPYESSLPSYELPSVTTYDMLSSPGYGY